MKLLSSSMIISARLMMIFRSPKHLMVNYGLWLLKKLMQSYMES